MAKEREEKEYTCGAESYGCPLGSLFAQVNATFGATSEFRKHIYNSKIEFLKAMRSIIDQKIENLETKAQRSQKRATKINVE